jgi:hypothetical protein
MKDFASSIARIASAVAALGVALLLAVTPSVSAQQGSPILRQIAANDSPAGGARLGTPGAALGAPGAAMAPAGTEPKMAEPGSTPGAAMAPKGPGAASEGMGGEPTLAEKNQSLLYEHAAPTRVRIAIVNATGHPNGAAKVAVLLGEYQRRPLEDKMGLKIELVNLSTGYDRTKTPAVVYYRPGYLRAALLLAQAIPGDTMVAAMRPQALKRAGLDVEVVVGEALP